MEIGAPGMSPGQLQQSMGQENNAKLVTQTLDKMNTSPTGQVNQDFQMQKDVLQAGVAQAMGKGLNLDSSV